MIGKIATVHHVQDIAYHAKGISNIFDMHIMPQYYLISPAKDIVYKSNDLGNYEEVLDEQYGRCVPFPRNMADTDDYIIYIRCEANEYHV